MEKFTGGYSSLASRYYDRYIGDATLGAIRDLVDAEVDALPQGARCVDVGCAGGQVLAYVAGRRPDLELVGVEPSARLRAAAARRCRVPIVDGTAERPGVPPGSADAVLSLFTIKHWPDQDAGMAGLAELLAPGGRLLVTELDADATLEEWRAFVARTRLPRPVQRVYAPLTLRAFVRGGVGAPRLASLAESAGLEGVAASTVPGIAISVLRARVGNARDD